MTVQFPIINTKAGFQTDNPILYQGQFGVEWDTAEMKIGDGSSRYAVLPYISGGEGIESGTTTQRMAIIIPSGVVYLDTTQNTLWAGDGSTPGGIQISGQSGLIINGQVATYANLPTGLGPSDAGTNRVVQADGLLYTWSGTAWPANGAGVKIQGPTGTTGSTGQSGQNFIYGGTVATYTSLPSGLGPQNANTGYVCSDDGLMYVWNGTTFPSLGSGAPFQGPQGQQGSPGPVGAGVTGPVGPAGSSNIPIVVHPESSYTLLGSDAGSELDMSSSSNNTINVPDNVLNGGDMLIVRNIGTAKTTVQGSGAMQLLSASGSTAVLSQYQSCGIIVASGTTAYLDTGAGASVQFALVGTLPPGNVGIAYSATLQLSGTYTLPVAITIPSGSLPGWMSQSLSGTTVTFSGTPTAVATTAFTVRATDSSATPLVANSAQSVAIAAAATFTMTGTLPNGQVGVPYSATLTLGGSYNTPVAIDASSGVIPAWMTATAASGVVTFAGTPTTAETEAFTARATDASTTARIATSPQSIVIAAAAPKASIVQSAKSTTTNATTTRSATLAAAPTPGNFIVALLGYNQSITLTSQPSGFTPWPAGRAGAPNGRIGAFIHQVQVGDPLTYTFGWSAAQYQSVLLYEISSSTGSITAYNVNTTANSAFPITIAAPAEAGNGLALAWVVIQSGTTTPTANAGWTTGVSTNTVGYSTFSWSQNTVSSSGSSCVISDPAESLPAAAGIIVIGA